MLAAELAAELAENIVVVVVVVVWLLWLWLLYVLMVWFKMQSIFYITFQKININEPL